MMITHVQVAETVLLGAPDQRAILPALALRNKHGRTPAEECRSEGRDMVGR